MLLANPIQSHASAKPHALAVRFEEQQWTWSELLAEVRQRACDLDDHGVKPGHRVALKQRPGMMWMRDFHAAIWLGAVPVLFSDKLANKEFFSRLEKAEVQWRLDEILRDTSTGGNSSGQQAEPWTLESPLFMVWTSGSTGPASLVPVLTRQAIFSAIGAMSRLGVSSNDTWLAALPLHHVGGAQIAVRAAIFGFAVEVHPTFDAHACNEAIDTGRIQVFSAVPKMLTDILNAREDLLFPDSLRAIMLGGARASDSLMKRLKAIDAPVSLTWGMSETGSHVATNVPGDLGTSFPFLPFTEVEARDGVLEVIGPLAPDGRLRTSDRGEVTVDGKVRVTGRRDNVIISGGENIDLDRLEKVYETHPAIREVVAVGLDDMTWGARPHLAFVKEEEIEADDLRAFGSEHLEEFEIPDSFTPLETFPRNHTGKTDRAELARRLRQRVTPS
jgi:O-succinylbenzoic acid--CoA ligase